MAAVIIQFPGMKNGLPNRIRELRKAKGWQLKHLAAELGCGITQVSDLETGGRELTLHWMQRVARALGTEPADLLAEGDNSRTLSSDELVLLERFRRGDLEQRRQLLSMSEIVIPDTAAKRSVAS